jgi:hypothetical protein
VIESRHIKRELNDRLPKMTGTAAFAIGGHAWAGIGAGLEHRGLLAMAGQWNRPLNQAEMLALYNSGRGRRYETLSREEPSMGRRRVYFVPSVTARRRAFLLPF